MVNGALSIFSNSLSHKKMSKLANNNADLSLVRRRVVYPLSLSFIFFFSFLLFYLKRKKSCNLILIKHWPVLHPRSELATAVMGRDVCHLRRFVRCALIPSPPHELIFVLYARVLVIISLALYVYNMVFSSLGCVAWYSAEDGNGRLLVSTCRWVQIFFFFPPFFFFFLFIFVPFCCRPRPRIKTELSGLIYKWN